MVQIKKMINQILQQLYFFERAEIDMGHSESVHIQLLDNRSKIKMTTIVYIGQDYIPNSVRNCYQEKAPFPNQLHTFLILDEEQYKIFLNYEGELERLNEENLNGLLEEFNWQAEEWRLYLDENDRNDLIHVRVSR